MTLFRTFVATVTALVAVVGAHAETISNTATIQWTAGPNTLVRRSNQVDLFIDRQAPLTVTTYQMSSGPAAQPINVPNTLCRNASGVTEDVKLPAAYSALSTKPASVVPTNEVRAGQPLVLSVNSQADNKSSTAIDTMSVTIKTVAGDSETIIMQESGVDTGVFVGMVRTTAIPPAIVPNNCALSLKPGDSLMLDLTRGDGSAIAAVPIGVLVDPYGVTFDSADGKPVSGTTVTLINVATGQPATVYGDDGNASFPATVVSGSTVTDSAGVSYAFPPGEYRFPLVAPGTYKLVFGPPAPYTAPSVSTPDELAPLRRPDGQPFVIIGGSYGGTFTLSDPNPVRIDVPLDKPGGGIAIRKSASLAVAVPGDAVQYRVTISNADSTRPTAAVTITDILPEAMRLQPDTVRYNGTSITYKVSSDGRQLTTTVPPLAIGGSGTLTYLLEIRPDARDGMAVNRASARDARGTISTIADSAVRIARDGIADRMTIIGRVTDGGNRIDPQHANGVPGVRVMLEDGSYAVTDPDGRYHFDGVMPGLHVVQIEPATLGAALVPDDCTDNARSAGSLISRFVEGRGGGLYRVDFCAKTGTNTARGVAEAVAPRTPPATEQHAAGADRDWFAGQTPGIEWLFPEVDHNPRTKAVRVAIKHLPGQTVKLYVDGKPVNPMTFDSTRKGGDIAISLWRGVELPDRNTMFSADVLDASGAVVSHLTRAVHFSASPMFAELVKEKSVLIADGVTRPVIAVRLTDRDGKPIHQGLVGDFAVPAPYYPAVEADAQTARQLSGLERARPVWHVEGDDGIAYIELEPTTASGALTLTLPFRDLDVVRTQRIDTWLTPGNRPWTVVGFAAGTVGFNTLNGNLERLRDRDTEWLTSGRVALYAKGRIKGQWLMTMAYDTGKQEDQSRFGGVIDPQAYYTVYADRSERRYDAQSVRKLYLRLERPQFYAMFGDFETGMSEPQLTRYVRAMNGVKAQFRNERVTATAFAADTPYTHRREEIQGNGLSGPYALQSRDILPNSETILIETRDRLRSDRIVDSKALVRHIDYDIDYLAGTIVFRSPVLSRSSSLDPQFIIVDYELNGTGKRTLNAGGRATWTSADRKLIVGASVVHDETDTARTNMGGVDLKYRPDAATEVRAEFAASNAHPVAGATSAPSGTATAWLFEAEHHGARVDVLAYARQQQAAFGVGQTNTVEGATSKLGLDSRLRITEQLSLLASGWVERQLGTGARRIAGQARAEYRAGPMDLRAGVTVANDRLTDGSIQSSTVVQLGATRRFMGNRLELDAQTEFGIGKAQSIDVPARHLATARFAVTDYLTAIASYEIAKSDVIDARTARFGVDVKPWAGGRITATTNRQDIAEYGPRTYAAFGLAQTVPIGKRWTVDATLDANRTLGGVDAARVLNTAHPVASGGFLGTDGAITEDFTAVTAGATYRGDRWSWTGRAEYRDGELSTRYGVMSSIMRSVGEGRSMGGTFSWFHATKPGGPTTNATSLALSWAHRPDDADWAVLDKLELRSDSVTNAVAGAAGPIGGAPLLVTGNASSKRIINSLSVNYSPNGQYGERYLGRHEIALFWGARYVADRYDQDDIEGFSNLFGADIRFDLNDTIDVGFAGSAREGNGARSWSFSGGPSLGVSPFKNAYVSIGYNVIGYRDRDYQDAQYTRSGPYVTLRFKFDQDTLSSLGLGTRH